MGYPNLYTRFCTKNTLIKEQENLQSIKLQHLCKTQDGMNN